MALTFLAMGSVQRCGGMNSMQRLRQRPGNKHRAIIRFILGINFPPPSSLVINNPFVSLLDNFLCRKRAVGGLRAPAATPCRWGASCPSGHRGEFCHVPQGNQHSALAKAVPPSQQRCHMFGIDCATWQGGEMPSGLFFTPMSPRSWGCQG